MHQIQIITHPSAGGPLPDCFHEAAFEQAQAFHRSLDGYEPTPLISLKSLASRLGLKGIYIKDESYRFGLNAFKALGASYAVHCALESNPDIAEFVAATDGNHGRAVAWAASQKGRRATIFMPDGSADCRVQAIRDTGAEVTVTELNYDDAVRMAHAYAQQRGACLVQDTGFEGYREIPQNIVLGYSTMAAEALEQMSTNCGRSPSHVFLQAGVGSMAGGVIAYIADKLRLNLPRFAIIEANEAACIFESVRQGHPVSIGGHPQTAMAGLNCGEPNIYTLPLLLSYADFYIKCSDDVSYQGMRQLARPLGRQSAEQDLPVIAGECGAVGLGVLMEIMQNKELAEWKKQMGLDETSEVLLFSTEGNTDPDHYKKVLEEM